MHTRSACLQSDTSTHASDYTSIIDNNNRFILPIEFTIVLAIIKPKQIQYLNLLLHYAAIMNRAFYFIYALSKYFLFGK